MSISKAWDWSKEKSVIWRVPSEESHYLAAKWKRDGYQALLDFGCGLGRHSVFFSQCGFSVSAFDLSADAAEHLRAWAEQENLTIDIQVSDMMTLPYADHSFDCVFAYNVISHTNTTGFLNVMSEVRRVMKPGGELFLTLCSKGTWSFAEAGFPKMDENTVIRADDGPEKGIPHFYVDLDDIIRLFGRLGIEPLRIRHIDDCYQDGQQRNSKHYFILAGKPGRNAP